MTDPDPGAPASGGASHDPAAGEPVASVVAPPVGYTPTSVVDDAPPVRPTGLVPLHPAAVVIWRITGLVWVVLAGLVAVTIGALAGSVVAVSIAVAATTALTVMAWVLPARRYRRWRYAIGEDALEIHRGVWTRTSSAVPFHRIQQIDVAQGPLQRRHGVVTLQLRTAAAASDGTVPHLDADDAARLRTGLLRVAARSIADDGH